MEEKSNWPIWRTGLRLGKEDLAKRDQPENPSIALEMIYDRIGENQNGMSCFNILPLSLISKLYNLSIN